MFGKTKRCTKCKQSYTEEAFHKDRHRPDGLKTYCKQCVASLTKSNKEVKREYDRIRRLGDVEERRVYSKDYYQTNKDKIRKYNMEVYRGQKGELRSAKLRVRVLVRNMIRKLGGKKTSNTLRLLGAPSWEYFLNTLGPKPEGDCHLDHICPCSQAKTIQELYLLQHVTNLRWLSAAENREKSNKRTIEGEELCRRLLNRDWEE